MNSPIKKMRKLSAFTIVELLVVIAIIAILASLLLPALKKAREKGKTIACMSNMKNICMAETAYLGDSNDYISPIAPGRDANGCTDYYWTNLLSSYLNFDGETRNSFRDNIQPATSVYFCPGQNPQSQRQGVGNPNCYPSYGINGYLAGGGVLPGSQPAVSAKASSLTPPGKIALFTDVQNGPTAPQTGYRTVIAWYFTSRHPGLQLNVVWLDGHISNIRKEWANANVTSGEDILAYIKVGTKYWS